ncbi:hypothetical protein EST92_11570 [Streptomyces sp. TM32]|uniref:hypothetical protein n=1 Tax=Streptomyces sp. TM32 TaxID=1652669 RepID=UPI0010101BDA|nr:hypothetical protein [Streptomyces sp. TM32]RXS84190.1 hypothetical protein EST92_11570 [Streptomyces sp. TM32]
MTAQPTIRDDVVAVIARDTTLPVDQAYSLADAILTEVTKTDRLIDQDKVYHVIETDWNDSNDEYATFTVYAQPEAEEIR